MAKITGATLAPIYERLNGAPSYHPLEADTFADWSVEAGDIVTITRDGKSYDSPVHNSTMTWRKGQKIAISSTGNEKRDSVAKLSQRKYNRGSSGIRNSQSMFQHIETSYNGMTAGLMLASSSAALYVNNKYTQMQSGLSLTESSAHLYTENKYSQMSSGLKLSESSAHLYTENKYTQMSSGLKLSESSARLYVDSKYNQMKAGLDVTMSSAALYAASRTSRAYIMARINADGEGEALIEADKVKITGDTTLAGTMTIEGGALVVKKNAVFQGNATLTDANGYVQAKNFNVASGGALKFIGTQTGEQYSLSAASIQGFIKEASVDGNVLTLTPVHGDPITFSKAVSLSGAWNSNVYTVTASPQGTTISTSIGSRFGVNQGNYYIEAYRSADSGAPGISGASITYQLANNDGTVELQDTNGSRIADTPTYAIPLQEKTVTSNGTVTPDSGYVGLNSVIVDVPTSAGGNKARFNSGDGQYFIEAYDNASGTSVAGSSLAYLLTAEYISGSGIEVQIQDTGGTKLGNTRTCPIWLLSSQSGVNNQGTLAYDTYYGISSGSTILATWKTPEAPSHSPDVSVQTKYTGSISGRTSKGSAKASELANTYILIDVKCGGVTNKFYITINP